MIMGKCTSLLQYSTVIYSTIQYIFLIIRIGNSSAFIYFHWYLKKYNTNTNTETTIYQTYKQEVSKKYKYKKSKRLLFQ